MYCLVARVIDCIYLSFLAQVVCIEVTMSILKRLIKSFQVLWQELLFFPAKLARWLTRQFFHSTRRRDLNRRQAGFILPTVVMVILVVTLLTTTIVFRSFDRAKNANNVRVNQVVLNAALPAIERAKKKIDALFADPTLPQGTPTDTAITNAFSNSTYDLGDEVRLRLADDINGINGIETDFGTTNSNISPTNEEVITTAWRFPVDTDNNGQFDSFTLYGIYYRSPSSSAPRARTTIEARTPPQDDSATSRACATALNTSASLTGAEGWYKVGGTLKKGFYVYTTTVPIIADPNTGQVPANLLPDNTHSPYDQADLYEPYTGNRGFSAIEYQQDRTRIPLGNNAVVYEDDLQITIGSTTLNLNGRIVANSNINTGVQENQGSVHLYQVSSKDSCFYEAENGKIFVGGNISNGQLGKGVTSLRSSQVDLYKEGAEPDLTPTIDSNEESTNQIADRASYNTQAYEERIALLVRAALDQYGKNNPPKTIRDEVNKRLSSATETKTEDEIWEEEYTTWFRQRTRRVPFQEVPFGDPGTGTRTVSDVLTASPSVDYLRPIDAWHYPLNATTGRDEPGTTGLTLKFDRLQATNPDELGASELLIGDRILVGNNLPERWFDPSTQDFATDETRQFIQNVNWTGSTAQRYRTAHVSAMDDLGNTSRDGFWEEAAAKLPENALEGYGGLRIVTGAGIYLPLKADEGNILNLDLNNPSNSSVSRVVWPDTMPVIPYIANEKPIGDTNSYLNLAPWLGEDTNNSNPNILNPDILDDENGKPRPFLRMRATAVYHYIHDEGNTFDESTPAPPIACISSFYDPTDSTTARNLDTGRDVSGDIAWENTIGLNRVDINSSQKNSNNGITYDVPRNISTNLATNDILKYQAQLVYPNGRLVNAPLAKALDKLSGAVGNSAGGLANLSYADRAAIDSALCALQILAREGVNTGFTAIGPNENPTGKVRIPNGTIQEVAFLDARETKNIEGNSNTCGGSGCNSGDNTYDNQPIKFGRALDTPDLTTPNNANCTTANCISQYDLAVELRQPLEIRATAIDLDLLRRQNVTQPYANGPKTEWLFPDGGVIYASRDDALPDASDRPADPSYNRDGTIDNTISNLYEQELNNEKVSATDFWLDPTRRPNGILLINGSSLGRGNPPQNKFENEGEEKGLILASNLPVYIKGGFNLHTGGSGEEFNDPLNTSNWNANFYTRSSGTNGSGFNKNFACRKDDARLPECQDGDEWRQATILADTVTVLSSNYRFGFRSDGDFDLRNNETDNLFRNITSSTLNPIAQNTNIPVKSSDDINKARRDNGFWDNSFVVNGLSSDNDTGIFGNTSAAYTDQQYGDRNQTVLGSSYFNDGVVPVQRRKNAPEYVMEICRKLPISNCQPSDWIVGYDQNGDNDLEDLFKESDINANLDINGNGIPGETTDIPEKDITAEQLLRITAYVDVTSDRVGAGTTALAPIQANDQHYARRVAFKRFYGNLELIDASNTPAPSSLGIDTNNRVAAFEYQTNSGGSPTGAPGAGAGPGAGATAQSLGGNIVYNGRPRDVDNSLWFRMSGRDNGELWSDIQYTDNNRWLSYAQPSANPNGNALEQRTAYVAGYESEQDDWLLPDISTSSANTAISQITNALNILNGAAPANPTNDNDDLVDYSVCIRGSSGNGFSREAQVTTNIGGVCAPNPDGAIDELRNLSNPNNIPITGAGSVRTTGILTLGPEGTGNPINNTSIYVYEVNTVNIVEQANSSAPTTTTTYNFIGSNNPENPVTPTPENPAFITLTGDKDTIFVFRPKSANLGNPFLFQNIHLILQGVNPNNIFWISEEGMTFSGTNRLAGNFLSKANTNSQLRFDIDQIPDSGGTYPVSPTSTRVDGGRFLGFNGSGDANYNNFNVGVTLNAVTTSHQPLLVPVLQIHLFTQTNVAPANRTKGNNRDDFRNNSNWLQRSANTKSNANNGTFNLVMATGDSPGRYRNSNPQVLEVNGSLSNLVRMQENWYDTGDNQPLTIRGSFIQLKRSSYATAPFWQLLGPDGNNNATSLFGYRQSYSVNSSSNNSYSPPERNFGFDVGILSQLPDLFSQRFTLPPTEDPNEYYREVGRDDDWIQTLLCATFSDANGAIVGGRFPVNTDYRNSCLENP